MTEGAKSIKIHREEDMPTVHPTHLVAQHDQPNKRVMGSMAIGPSGSPMLMKRPPGRSPLKVDEICWPELVVDSTMSAPPA